MTCATLRYPDTDGCSDSFDGRHEWGRVNVRYARGEGGDADWECKWCGGLT